MQITFWIAQILAIVGAISNIVAMQLNKKNQILIMYVISNWSYAINFVLLGAYTGAMICFIGGAQTLINNFFDSKNRNIPKFLLVIYMFISVSLGVISYSSLIDVMPIICSVIYIILITIKKESNIRKLTLLDMIIWTIYDFIVMAYSAAIFDFSIVISTVIGMYRYDFKKIEKNK